MILATLLIFSKNDKCQTQKECLEEFERCVRTYKCEHDNEKLSDLDEQTKKRVLKCRIERLIKCSQPEEDKL